MDFVAKLRTFERWMQPLELPVPSPMGLAILGPACPACWAHDDAYSYDCK
jgi:hypothetical protein